jgi:hypothetical protein
MSGPKIHRREYEPRIRQFWSRFSPARGIEVPGGAGPAVHPEIEDPELMVLFSGRMSICCSPTRPIVLALEHLTIEVLHVPSDEQP